MSNKQITEKTRQCWNCGATFTKPRALKFCDDCKNIPTHYRNSNNGVCIECGGKCEDRKSYCAECLRLMEELRTQDARQKRNAYRFCRDCGEHLPPYGEGGKRTLYCLPCRGKRYKATLQNRRPNPTHCLSCGKELYNKKTKRCWPCQQEYGTARNRQMSADIYRERWGAIYAKNEAGDAR